MVKNNKIVIILSVLLLISIFINYKYFTLKPDSKGAAERQIIQLRVDSLNLEINSLRQAQIEDLEQIDSLKGLKRTIIYYEKNSKDIYDKKVDNYYTFSDSVRFYDWAEYVYFLRLPK